MRGVFASNLIKAFVLTTVLGLTGCSKTKEKPDDKFLLRKTEAARDSGIFSGPKQRPYRVRKYDLKASYQWDKKLFVAEERIELEGVDDVFTFALDAKSPQISEIKIIKEVAGLAQEFVAAFEKSEEEVTIYSPVKLMSGEKFSVVAKFTVDLTLAPSEDALLPGIFLYEAVAADPAKEPLLYTASEPNSASTWLICDDAPQRRAIFRTEFTHAKNERFLANGALVSSLANTQQDGTITTIYETKNPLPPYLMAFALGDMRCAEGQTKSGLPTQYCVRRSLSADIERDLKVTNSQIESIEEKLGPFPWEKYTTVLIPNFPAGGMENAGITFNHENLENMSAYRGAMVQAHELGHQWFGDYVTVSTWDDLWIKEGMATLIQDEVVKPFGQEVSESNPQFYQQFEEFNEKDAIIDPNIINYEKYTSGPYERASWYLSQLRSLVGAPNFWATLRLILEENKFSHIGSEEFVAHFSKQIPEALHAPFKEALYAKGLGKFALKANRTPENYEISFSDPTKSFLYQPGLRIVNASSLADMSGIDLLTGPVNLDLSNAFVTMDPNGAHGPTDFFIDDASKEIWKNISALPTLRATLVPQTPVNLIAYTYLLQRLNPRERIALLKASDTLDNNEIVKSFYYASKSRYENNSHMSALCERKIRPVSITAMMNAWALEMVADDYASAVSLQNCNQDLDVNLWTAFDANPTLEERLLTKQSFLGMNTDRASRVWIPLLKSSATLSAKRMVINALNAKFTEKEVAQMTSVDRTAIHDQLVAIVPDYKDSDLIPRLEFLLKKLESSL